LDKKNEERVDAIAAGTLHGNSASDGFPLNCSIRVDTNLKTWRKVGVASTPPEGEVEAVEAVEAHAVGNLVDVRLNQANDMYDDVM
jgi:hypothetical protein